MKVNELMIGDWVYMRPQGAEKYYEDRVCSLSDASFLDYIPIPLTAEILEKNGWYTPRTELFNVFSSQYETHGGDTCITLDNIHHELSIRLDDINYSTPLPKYVHELQHALRICGLNSLANNIKI